MGLRKSAAGAIVAGVVLSVPIGVASGATDAATCLFFAHILAGTFWIGLVYYFAFVHRPAFAAAAADPHRTAPIAIASYVAPRAIAWLRWTGVAAWSSGSALLLHHGLFDDAFTLGLTAGASTEARVIGVGAWLGTLMLLDVWLLIWPNQKKLLGLVEASAEELSRAMRIVDYASRANAILSIPLLASMVGFGHGDFA